MIVGILALQGGFTLHQAMFSRCGVASLLLRRKEQIASCDAIVIPGGESSTLRLLLHRRDMWDGIKKRVEAGAAYFGTCAGAILASSDIFPHHEVGFRFLDLAIKRNAYGRQKKQF